MGTIYFAGDAGQPVGGIDPFGEMLAGRDVGLEGADFESCFVLLGLGGEKKMVWLVTGKRSGVRAGAEMAFGEAELRCEGGFTLRSQGGGQMRFSVVET